MTRPRFLSEDRICWGQPPSMVHVLGLLWKWVTVPDPVGQGEGRWPGGCCPSEYWSGGKGGLPSPRFFLGSHGTGPGSTGWCKPNSHEREARSPLLRFGRKGNVIYKLSNNSHPWSCSPDTCQSLDVGYPVPTMKDLTSLHNLPEVRTHVVRQPWYPALGHLEFPSWGCIWCGESNTLQIECWSWNCSSAPMGSHSFPFI